MDIMDLMAKQFNSINKGLRKIVFLILILSSTLASAQELEKNSVYGNILGLGGIVGLSYERILFDHLSFEIGLGIVGAGAGLTIYPIKRELGKIRPYSGIRYTFMELETVGSGNIAYIPFGLCYFSKSRLNIGIDIGPDFGKWSYDNDHLDDSNPRKHSDSIKKWGNVKIGFRF